MTRIDRRVVLVITTPALGTSFKLFFNTYADAAEAADTICEANEGPLDIVIRSRREEDARR